MRLTLVFCFSGTSFQLVVNRNSVRRKTSSTYRVPAYEVMFLISVHNQELSQRETLMQHFSSTSLKGFLHLPLSDFPVQSGTLPEPGLKPGFPRPQQKHCGRPRHPPGTDTSTWSDSLASNGWFLFHQRINNFSPSKPSHLCLRFQKEGDSHLCRPWGWQWWGQCRSISSSVGSCLMYPNDPPSSFLSDTRKKTHISCEFWTQLRYAVRTGATLLQPPNGGVRPFLRICPSGRRERPVIIFHSCFSPSHPQRYPVVYPRYVTPATEEPGWNPKDSDTSDRLTLGQATSKGQKVKKSNLSVKHWEGNYLARAGGLPLPRSGMQLQHITPSLPPSSQACGQQENQGWRCVQVSSRHGAVMQLVDIRAKKYMQMPHFT